jgi:leucyl aminopeptidase
MELPKIELHAQTTSLVDTLKTQASNYDGLVVLFTEKEALVKLIPSLQKYVDLDASFGSSIQLVLPEDGNPSKRVLIAPTGSLLNDFDDSRRFKG